MLYLVRFSGFSYYLFKCAPPRRALFCACKVDIASPLLSAKRRVRIATHVPFVGWFRNECSVLVLFTIVWQRCSTLYSTICRDYRMSSPCSTLQGLLSRLCVLSKGQSRSEHTYCAAGSWWRSSTALTPRHRRAISLKFQKPGLDAWKVPFQGATVVPVSFH